MIIVTKLQLSRALCLSGNAFSGSYCQDKMIFNTIFSYMLRNGPRG